MKRKLMLCTALLTCAGVLALGTQARLQDPSQPEETDQQTLPTKDWKRGLAISPVKLNLQGKNQKMVGLGSLLVNAQGGCLDCHTTPTYATGGNPFMGQPEKVNTDNYMAGGAKFGPFTAPNLTPDPATGLPAKLTQAQFLEEIKTGKDLKNRHPQLGPILQVFPWPVYSKMTDDDLKAIYEYLRAIPPAQPVMPPVEEQ